MGERKITKPADDTTKPDVDEKEPIKAAPKPKADDGDDGDDTAKATATDVKVEDGPGIKRAGKPKADDDADASDGKKTGKAARKVSREYSQPDVSGGGGDGATYAPAIGTSREMASKLSTKEGSAPIGVERDEGAVHPDPTGPKTDADAALYGRGPAGVVLARGQAQEVAEGVNEVIRDFASNVADDTAILGTSNIHDDLGIQRAHIVHLAAAVEEKFGIDITPSEAQNFLLVRDIYNTVLRKLAKNG